MKITIKGITRIRMTGRSPIIADRIYITRGIITRQRGIKLRSTIHLKLSSLIGSTPRIIFRCLCISHPISHFQRPPLFIRRHIPTGRTNSLSLFRNTASHSYTPSIMHSVNLVIRLDTIMQTLIRFIIIYSRTITHMAVIDIPTTHVLDHPATTISHFFNRITIGLVIQHIILASTSREHSHNRRCFRITVIIRRGPTHYIIGSRFCKYPCQRGTLPRYPHSINIPTINQTATTYFRRSSGFYCIGEIHTCRPAFYTSRIQIGRFFFSQTHRTNTT